jgi:hypothetical protein
MSLSLPVILSDNDISFGSTTQENPMRKYTLAHRSTCMCGYSPLLCGHR